MTKITAPPIRLAIAVPTYNESKNIVKLVKQIKYVTGKSGIYCCVLIIDDNSPDGTGDIADKLAAQENGQAFKIQVLHRDEKQGINKAYISGFHLLLSKDYTHIMQMDADLSHDPKYISQFIQALLETEFVVGSRYIQGGGTPDWAFHRKLLSRFGNMYASIFLGNRIHDYTGGYNLYSSQLLKNINPNTIRATGYGFLIELKFRALKQSYSVAEIPIIFKERRNGVSKIPKNTILNNLILVPKLALVNCLARL